VSDSTTLSQLEALKMRLKRILKCDVELVVNENRSSMLNLLDKKQSGARLSVHRMFLEAPDPVIAAIAHYVRGSRRERPQHNLVLRKFIQEHLAQSDYTHLVDEHRLIHQGKHYDVKEIYDALNKKYFNGELELAITWYGKAPFRRRRRITYGQYLSGLKLIKIHRLLDNPFFPPFFVSFVVYHEMLHSIIPGCVDGRGRFSFHTTAFRKQEKAFEEYERAINWEKINKIKFLE
jgi:hypothetical protein